MERKEFSKCLNTTGRVYGICYGPQGIYTTQALFIISSKMTVQSKEIVTQHQSKWTALHSVQRSQQQSLSVSETSRCHRESSFSPSSSGLHQSCDRKPRVLVNHNHVWKNSSCSGKQTLEPFSVWSSEYEFHKFREHRERKFWTYYRSNFNTYFPGIWLFSNQVWVFKCKCYRSKLNYKVSSVFQMFKSFF